MNFVNTCSFAFIFCDRESTVLLHCIITVSSLYHHCIKIPEDMDTMNDYQNQTMSTNQGTSSFVPEILSMMQSFGDGPKCNPGSAHLIEEVVRTQMNSSLMQCYSIALSRTGGTFRSIGLAEILLFLMRRKDTMKCVRLLKHLNLKDNLSTFDTSSGSILTTGSSSEDSVWTGAVQSFSSLGSSSETMDQQISGSSSFGSFDTVSNSKKKSRMKVCTDFLTLIDESNTILDTFHSHEFVDQIKLSRNIRIDRLTREMNESEYSKFCQSRSVSFSSKNKSKKFRHWLLSGTESVLGSPVTIDVYGMEAFQWLAHELVAEIVDYCFIVQQGKKKDPSDAVQGVTGCKKNQLFTLATTQSEHSCLDGLQSELRRGIKRKLSNPEEFNQESLTYYGSISPADVREVSRRYFSSSSGNGGNVFNLLKKHEPNTRLKM